MSILQKLVQITEGIEALNGAALHRMNKIWRDCSVDKKRGLFIFSAAVSSFVLASITAFCSTLHAAEDRTFDVNSTTVRDKVDRILIDKSYCINGNDCRKKKYIFTNPRSDGFDVYVYGINDPSVINKIVLTCLEERLVARFDFSIRIYSVTKDQELSRSMWDKPSYSEFTFKWDAK